MLNESTYILILILLFIHLILLNKNKTTSTSLYNVSYESKLTLNCFYKKKRYYKCQKNNVDNINNKNILDKERYNPLSDYILYNIPYISKSVKILIYNICLCREFDERWSVRKTWGINNDYIRTLYVIGNTNKECEKRIKKESELFKDILRININENYYNATLFTLYLLKLLPTISKSVELYIKANLDDYINWKIFFSEYNKIRDKDMIFIVTSLYSVKRIPSNNRYKYSSSKRVAKYYNKLIPKKGIKGFNGYFYAYSYKLSLLLYNESLKYPILINAEDQYVMWLLYSMNFTNFIKIKSLNQPKDLMKNNKNYCVIHRVKGSNLLAFYKYMNK